jgi:peptide/nickel transport system ATP-binding protein
MYAGEIVETAPREVFFERPAHPYSRKLFDSLPARHKRGDTLAVIRGSVPPLSREFTNCRFVERCDHAWDLCHGKVPVWHGIGEGQGARCHLFATGAEMRNASKGMKPKAVSSAVESNPVSDSATLLQVDDLKVHFPVHKGVLKRVAGHVRAVDGITLTINSGKTLGLVGESGCGKTTVGKSILRLIEPTAGAVVFSGSDLAKLNRAEMRARRRHVQIIFQDPYASLNPRMRIAETIEEGMTALGIGADREQRQSRIDSLLGEVGLSPDVKYRYPHEFSGGQRQRIAIARALAVDPQLIICDEPTSALDVSVQAQILNLLKQLQEKMGLSYLFISHNISVIEFLAHEVAVMYLGRIVERGTVEEVLENPQHPYTRALLSAVPAIDASSRREVIRLQGDLPSPVNPPRGCHFHPRCAQALPQCLQNYPGNTAFSATHSAHCHLYAPS